MEGRTPFNYGHNTNILTLNNIRYMYRIVRSNLADNIKAIKLYSFCNMAALLETKKMYEYLGLKEVELINNLINIYTDYEAKGYFKDAKNAYKCTAAEFEIRKKKLMSVYEIVHSDDKDYIKAEKLSALFNSAEEFRKSYSLFVKFGSGDPKLDSVRVALNDYEHLYATYKNYETEGIFKDIKYLNSVEDYLENYPYAKFIISSYNNSNRSYLKHEFLNEYGINNDIFEFCVETVAELDVDLYNAYLTKAEINKKILFMANKETISSIADAITNGTFKDGTPISVFEFMKRVPFKESTNFVDVLNDFMYRNNPVDAPVIRSYMRQNSLINPLHVAPLNIVSIYSVKTTIRGVELTNYDNDIIIDYLIYSNIPLVYRTFVIARDMYINGEITKEMVDDLKKNWQPKEVAKTLVPSI